MPTTIAGKYEVLERIGGGGQGTVFRVRHVFLQEVRALKVQTDPESGAGDSRVLREGRALARLRHPHIVQVFDLGRDGNQHYLEMEYVDGPNLAQRLRTGGRLPLREALTIVRQIADALAYAHAQAHIDSTGTPRAGMIHRDVKPSNILLRRGDATHALLADFGLVKLADASDRTQLGTLMGTYRYSAPEQLGLKRDGQRAVVDQRADLFSLGLVLFELIEGRPFHGALGSEEVIARLLLEREPLVPRFSTAVDPELSELVAAMVKRHPDERLAGGMAHVVRTLDRVMARLPATPAVADDAFDADDRTQAIGAVLAAHGARDTTRTAKPGPPSPALATPPPVRVVSPAPSAPARAPAPASGARWPWLAGTGAVALVALAIALWPAAEPLAPPPPRPRSASVEPAPDPSPTLRVPVEEPPAIPTEAPEPAPVVPAPTLPAAVAVDPPALPTPAVDPEPTPEPAPAPEGSAIAGRTPAAERVSVVQGDSLQLGVQLAAGAEGRGYRYAWFLDGRPVGSEPTWRYRPTEAPPRGPVQVEVEVTDEQSGRSERVAWRIDVRTPPPRIVEVRPAKRQLQLGVGEPGELFVRAIPGRPDAPLRYEWRIDRMPARITKVGTLAVPDDLAVGKHTIEVIAVDDEDDRRSAAQRFTVVVAAAPAPAPPPAGSPAARAAETPAPRAAAEPSVASHGRVTESEARRWVERLRSAWDRRDRGALRELGELPASGRVPRGTVTIGETSVIVDATGATVWYDRIEDGVAVGKRARLVRDPTGRVVRQ
jgi:serine/threonine-protein kinase